MKNAKVGQRYHTRENEILKVTEICDEYSKLSILCYDQTNCIERRIIQGSFTYKTAKLVTPLYEILFL